VSNGILLSVVKLKCNKTPFNTGYTTLIITKYFQLNQVKSKKYCAICFMRYHSLPYIRCGSDFSNENYMYVSSVLCGNVCFTIYSVKWSLRFNMSLLCRWTTSHEIYNEILNQPSGAHCTWPFAMDMGCSSCPSCQNNIANY